jgi:hypothetical protein
LRELAIVLDHLGFRVRKKSPREATLRVYPFGFQRYPLLNPRFTSEALYRGKTVRGAFLEINVWSKGDDRLDQHLRAFGSTNICEFVATGRPRPRYFHHGYFVIPVTFADARAEEIHFTILGRSLRSVRDHLRVPF